MNESTRKPTPPSWLNISLIEKALQKSLKEKLDIVESNVEWAASVGDNYGSQMLRFNLQIKTSTNLKNLSVLAKIKATGKLADQIEPIPVFEKETDAYSTALPAVEEYLKKAYPGVEKPWPNCYHHQGPPNELLILEDLKPKGYALDRRVGGLDLPHAILVLESMAKLHASSLLVWKNQLEILKNYEFSFWSRQNLELLETILLKPFLALTRNFQNWPEFEKKKQYLEKFKNLENIILEKTFQSWDKNENQLNVLLHGDCWTNNYMFKYNAGEVTLMKFIDFQLMSFNSPVLDIQYFTFSSVSNEVKFDCIDLLLEKYYNSFIETLNKLEYSVDNFSLEVLKKEFHKKCHWGFMVLCSMYPFVDSSDVFDPDNYFEGDQFEKVYERSETRKNLQKGFEYFEKVGIL